ncbi:hypothetical protein ACFLWZ_03940 [Chloroflexota bacterium]
MYLAELLNNHGLFQSISGLAKDQAGESDISEFLFRATSAVLHLERIQQLNQGCLAEYQIFADELKVQRKRIVLGSPTVVRLVNEIPPLLNTMRIMQDITLPMLARAQQSRFSVANSLNNAVKQLHKYAFRDKLKDQTLAYWQSSGSLLRDYRVLDKHHTTIIKHVLLEVQPKLKMLVLLPDNPSVQRSTLFTFNKERNALEYLPQSFQELHDWVENMAKLMGCKPQPINTSVEMSQLGELRPPTGGTLSLLIEHQAINGVPHFNAIEVSQLMDLRLSVRQISKKVVLEQQGDTDDGVSTS